MWFLLYKITKAGAKQVKNHRAKKHHQNNPDINLDPAFNPNLSDGKTGSRTIETEMISSNALTERNPLKTYLDIFLRIVQFSLGLVVIGMYGGDLHHQRHPAPSVSISTRDESKHADDKTQGKMDPRWLYAVIVGCLASITAFVHLTTMLFLRSRTPPSRRVRWVLPVFVWEAVMCLLSLIVFGIFGKVFLAKGPADGNEKMWRAVWVDLVAWGVWVLGMGWCGLRWWRVSTVAKTFNEAEKVGV